MCLCALEHRRNALLERELRRGLRATLVQVVEPKRPEGRSVLRSEQAQAEHGQRRPQPGAQSLRRAERG